MKNKKIGNFVKLLLFLTPFLIGFYGIMQLGIYSVTDCAYRAIQLYLMEFTLDELSLWEMNWAIQIARWAAPLATVTAVATVLYSMVDSVHLWAKLKTQKVIAVHGDSANIDFVLQNLGPRAVHTDKKMIMQADQHILMFDDDFDMYHFIDQHNAELMQEGDKRLFLCTEEILRGSYEEPRLVVCNIAENCARNYWEKFPISHKKERILLIGFENYGQRLLTQAILKNVVDVDSAIEYHVTGDYYPYLSKHCQMHKAVHVKRVAANGAVTDYKPPHPYCDGHDTVYFYDMEWYEILNRDWNFDRVIIAHDIDADNMTILNEIRTYFPLPSCHIKFTDENIITALWGKNNKEIQPFGINHELYEPETILKEKLFTHAKMIHGRYFANYQCDGICGGEACGNKQEGQKAKLSGCTECLKFMEDWRKLSVFLQYSNVAQADHISEKVRLLSGGTLKMDDPDVGKKVKALYDRLDEPEKRKLWHIEHIRWSRYHFMNNWDYAPKRDNSKRLHHLLVPFDQLDAAEQKKDGDAYEALEELLG